MTAGRDFKFKPGKVGPNSDPPTWKKDHTIVREEARTAGGASGELTGELGGEF